ncbi:YdcF family protein [Oricola sp.]|uniref:YdcF family protein n=1 Tax=Oricola sp. TaxID=1979950 RepID=UPI0025CE46DF|nr:YdcF family protein [Oricola sp.]MCI5077008.1 YdcF family protein [Oricola sp.]
MSVFFIVSKVAWLVIQPVGLLTLGLLLILLAALFKAHRTVRRLVVLEVLFLLVATQTNAGRLLIQRLENAIPRPAEVPAVEEVAGIIVLGGGFNGFVTRGRGGYELNEAGDRFVEALRLAETLPEVPLVITGGDASLIGQGEGDTTVARRFYAAFGVDPQRLVLEDRSRNTYENAVFTKAAIADLPPGKWLLVTSAFHMPRSVGIFRKQAIDIIPWPADYRTAGDEGFEIGRNDPAEGLMELSLALREWIGIVVYSATGRAEGVLPL